MKRKTGKRGRNRKDKRKRDAAIIDESELLNAVIRKLKGEMMKISNDETMDAYLSDVPIVEIPVVKKVLFQFGKPVKLEFD